MRCSVIIPVYNGEKYIAGAVRSALAQPEAGEVIIINDASADGTQNILEQLSDEDERVKLKMLTKNSGVAAARNFGVATAKEEWIAFLDADDVWHGGKLKKQQRRKYYGAGKKNERSPKYIV